MALIIVIVAVVVIVIIVIRRRRQKSAADQHDPDLIKEPTLFPVHSTKPIAFDKFCEHVSMLEKNSNLEYANEFEVSLCKFLYFIQLLFDDDENGDKIVIIITIFIYYKQ